MPTIKYVARRYDNSTKSYMYNVHKYINALAYDIYLYNIYRYYVFIYYTCTYMRIGFHPERCKGERV